MAKNIVICCDGTGNKFGNENTNVIKLYSALDLSDSRRQVAYYHAGLGTMGSPNALSRLARWWTKVIGLAFGYGLTRDISDAYAFLMDTFEPHDQVFMFGFSRGAYTVRALAGMLHMFGLIRKGDYNLILYAASMLKRKQSAATFQEAQGFKSTFSRECKPHFIGVWDTVSSVGWILDPMHVPYTANNPDLRTGRHAISIDERRCFFRQNLWGPPHPDQDIKQVWFAGVHCDVGGGYPECESGLSKISLEWMLQQAQPEGLLLNRAKVEQVLGLHGGAWVAPNAGGVMHNSMLDGAWVLLEPLPHFYIDTTVHPPREKLGRPPFGRRRVIPKDATIHDSVLQRKNLHIGYDPPNLPPDPSVEPWVPWKPIGVPMATSSQLQPSSGNTPAQSARERSIVATVVLILCLDQALAGFAGLGKFAQPFGNLIPDFIRQVSPANPLLSLMLFLSGIGLACTTLFALKEGAHERERVRG